MHVSDQEMLPAMCPSCGYPLTGLPEPRCPECGERVEEGEVVIVGAATHQGALPPKHTLWNSVISIVALIGFLATSGIWLILLATRVAHEPVFMTCLILAVGGFGALQYFSRGRAPYPASVWRICAMGYVFGAGRTKGKPCEWPRRMRVDIDIRHGVTRIRVIRMWRSLPLSKPVDIYARLTADQVKGLVERLSEWSPQGTVVRVRE